MRSEIYPFIERTQNSDCTGRSCTCESSRAYDAHRYSLLWESGELGAPIGEVFGKIPDSDADFAVQTPKTEKFSRFFDENRLKMPVVPLTRHKRGIKGTLYIAFTDGSATAKGRKTGGAAYIILDKNKKVLYENSKGFVGTTNNRMEMLAIISAVAWIPKGNTIRVYTDSRYCIQMFTAETISKEAKNQDLIKLFHKVVRHKRIQFVWVKGHNGDKWNERADRLATTAHAKISRI